jgi:hypothetical protein
MGGGQMQTMLIIVLISNVAQWVFILSISSQTWIKFEWQNTFFGKVRYGFNILLWRKTGPYSARGIPIIKFRWANPSKLIDKPYCKPKSIWAKPCWRK